MERHSVLLLLVCLLLGPVLLVLGTGDSTYRNPVLYNDHPDPGVLALPDGQGFVAVTTSPDARKDHGDPAFPIYKSKDLVKWDQVGHVFPAGHWPSWAFKDMWAPEIHFVGGRYMVYFSARHADTKMMVVGVAISKNPLDPSGPFEDWGGPLVEDEDGAIDATWFKDPMIEIRHNRSNLSYLAWKNDGYLFGKANIKIRRVEEDGVTFTPGSPPTDLIHANVLEDAWVVEAPWFVYRDPYYYLFFSGDPFMVPLYHVGVARSTNVTGPYERLHKQVLHVDFDRFDLGRNCTFVGPGHGSVVRTPAGEDWFVYHAWLYRRILMDPGRVMLLDRIQWTEDLWPMIGSPTDTDQAKPTIT